MHPYAIVSLFNAIAVVALGVFVFIKKTQGRIQRDWFLLSLAAGGWCLGTFFMNVADSPQRALFWNQVLNYFAIFIGPLFIKFGYSITRQSFKPASQFLLFFIAGLLLIAALAYPQAYLIEEVKGKYFHYIPRVGFIYHVYSIFFLGCVLYSLFFLYRQFKRSHKGATKNQLKYLFISMFIAFSGGASTLLICYGIEFPIGNYYFSLYAFVMSYAIVAHRLMDIEVIIKKTLVFAGLYFFILACILIPLLCIPNLFNRGSESWWVLAIIAIAIAGLAGPLNQFLVNITDKYLFQKKFDYRKVLKTASEGLANINSLNHQLRLVVHFLTMRARIKGAAIYMPENGESNYVLKASRPDGMGHQIKNLEYDSPILLYLKAEKKKTYLEYHSIEEAATKYAKNAMYSYNLPRMLDDMRRLHAQLVVPSFYQGKLQGILVLDGKKSDESYSEEDINLFQTIALESAIAFENARKHDELIEKNIKLEQMNDELKRTQAEVIQAKEEAAVSALSGGINHEIKNSIYGLTNNVDMVAGALDHISKALKIWYRSGDPVPIGQKSDLFDNLEEALGSIINVQQACQHIDDVARTLAEISKGKYAQMGRISIRTFLKGIVTIGMLRTYGDRVRTQALEHPPEVDAPRELPSVRAHTELLKAVFINFFKNSIYAMDGIFPKKILIRAMVDPDDKNMVRVEFSDNGKGIPPEVLPRIFDYGFSTKGSEGEGKGLFNVKTIIEGQHKGKITVESEVGKGTTFIIKLPIWKDEEE